MRSITKQLLIILISALPVAAMAHPGHTSQAGFWTGFIHPFTGLDHLTMAIGFGVLLWTVAKQWKVLGIVGLSLSLVFGFVLGANGIIADVIAEYGIVTSLIVLAVALWSKSYRVLPFVALLMASFHGAAHGVELAPQGHAIALISGMVLGMATLYTIGLVVGELINRHVPNGRKVLSALAMLVAIIGLA